MLELSFGRILGMRLCLLDFVSAERFSISIIKILFTLLLASWVFAVQGMPGSVRSESIESKILRLGL